MTASQFANLVRGKRVGKGKWTGFCPVHSDKHPSLSIRDMGDRMSLRCFGCGAGARQVLAALGLPAGEMYYSHGTRPDPEILRQIAEQEERYLRDQKLRRNIAGEAIKRAYDWDTASHEIARLLIAYPHDDRLAVLYHRCLDYMRRCECIAEAHYDPRLWGNGILPGVRRDVEATRKAYHLTAYGHCAWPGNVETKLTPSEIGSEIAGRIGVWTT